MSTLSPAQRIALDAVFLQDSEARIAWQTALSLRKLGLICGRYHVRPARLRLPTQWKITAAGVLAFEIEASP
jgi:hypothetical protein